MKQRVLTTTQGEQCNGANPLPELNTKNKKAVCNCVPVMALRNSIPTGLLSKAERMCKQP
jgi:hypothetical protein